MSATRIELGTRVKTCMGAFGTVRKQALQDDGSYNYRIVFDRYQPDGKIYYSAWIARDSFEVVAIPKAARSSNPRRRFALIAKMNLDIMDDQEHDRRVRDNTCHTTRRY